MRGIIHEKRKRRNADKTYRIWHISQLQNNDTTNTRKKKEQYFLKNQVKYEKNKQSRKKRKEKKERE